MKTINENEKTYCDCSENLKVKLYFTDGIIVKIVKRKTKHETYNIKHKTKHKIENVNIKT